ncbi:TPA: hypothetical protein ACFNV3_001745, partial [Neisseria meningitidis]
TASKVFWGIGVIRRFRFSVGLGKMDNIDGVGGIGGNGGIGGLKPTLQPALHLPYSLPYVHTAHPTPALPSFKQHFTQYFASAEKISNGLFYQMRKI